MRRILSVFLLIAILLFSVSCSGVRDFTHCEITLSLPRGYSECDSDEALVIKNSYGANISFKLSGAGSYDLLLSDGYALVALRRISFDAAALDGIPPMLTQLEFSQLHKNSLEGGGASCSEISHAGEAPYFSYERDGGGDSFTFLLAFLNSRELRRIILSR
mgnify:CR=1 FL=1